MKNGILIGLAVGLAACSTVKNSTEEKVKKNTKELIFDKAYLDPNVKATDDFFMYANGTWVKNNPVPASESRWGSFNELDQANKTKIAAIFDGLKEGVHAKGSYEQIIRDYYASYIDMTTRNEMGTKPIQAEYSQINSITNYTELGTSIAKLHRTGVGVAFRFGVGQDLKDVNKHITYFNQGGLGLPNKDYYVKDSKKEILQKYELYLKRLALLYGLDEAQSTQMAKASVAIEKRLAEHMMSPAELRIPENSYNKFAKTEIEEQVKNLDLDLYLSEVGSQSFETAVIGQPEFFKELNVMVRETPLEEWKAYLSLRLINHYAGHLDEKFAQAKFDFYQGVMSGKTEMKPIEEQAVNEITGMTIGDALGKLFVEKHFSQKAQNRVNTMVDNLLLTFDERIRALTWMTDSTKKEALIKLNSIGRKLGFPSKWEDLSAIDVHATTYVENYKKIDAWDHQENMAKLYKPVDKEKWGMPAHMVNAYYHPLLNEIAFPAGIMQAPFFDENAEDALNYGRIGMVIGHEFTHGFDDMGSKFAADGSFTNWWSEKDRTAFEARTKLLGNTFAGFCPIDGHCVNPDLTMGENIADLGGITLAYYAYTKTEEFKSGVKKAGFSPEQRFFLSFAQLWKINYTNEELKSRIANDPHSPGMYRVNGPLMNCPEFFEAFQIPEGSAMRNSETKLSKIW